MTDSNKDWKMCIQDSIQGPQLLCKWRNTQALRKEKTAASTAIWFDTPYSKQDFEKFVG